MTRSRGRRCLLRLIFVRLCGRLILLGRSSAYNNLQLPVLPHEAAVLRRANAPSRLDWAGRGLRHARPAPNAEPADAPDSHGRRRSPMTPPPDKRKPLTSRTNPAREGADPARQAPHLRGCYAPLDPPRRSHELAAIGNREQTGSRHGPGHRTRPPHPCGLENERLADPNRYRYADKVAAVRAGWRCLSRSAATWCGWWEHCKPLPAAAGPPGQLLPSEARMGCAARWNG
jgi:hypothetical protein